MLPRTRTAAAACRAWTAAGLRTLATALKARTRYCRQCRTLSRCQSPPKLRRRTLLTAQLRRGAALRRRALRLAQAPLTTTATSARRAPPHACSRAPRRSARAGTPSTGRVCLAPAATMSLSCLVPLAHPRAALTPRDTTRAAAQQTQARPRADGASSSPCSCPPRAPSSGTAASPSARPRTPTTRSARASSSSSTPSP